VNGRGGGEANYGIKSPLVENQATLNWGGGGDMCVGAAVHVHTAKAVFLPTASKKTRVLVRKTEEAMTKQGGEAGT